MSSWDKDLVDLAVKEKGISSKKSGKRTKKTFRFFRLFIVFTLFIASFFSFYYLTRQEVDQQNSVKQNSDKIDQPVSVEDENPKVETRLANTQSTLESNPYEAVLQLEFYNELNKLDNHNHLFAAFREVNMEQIKTFFKKHKHTRYSYFFEIGKTHDHAKVGKLQAKFLLGGWITSVRIKEHQGTRDYRFIIGPYYKPDEVTGLYNKLVERNMPYIIYALHLD